MDDKKKRKRGKLEVVKEGRERRGEASKDLGEGRGGGGVQTFNFEVKIDNFFGGL